MKKNLLITFFLLAVFAAVGQKLPFQGKLIQDGLPVDSTLSFEFSIASLEWSETHTDVLITDGLYFVVLGSINPLPDSLFYGVDEQSLNISVNGTALSPVILFKPLSSPFEGSELNVRNLDGTVVGTLKARTDSVKYGEFSILGENSGIIEAGFYKASDEAETDMPYVGLQKDSAYLVSISTRQNGTSLNGSLYLGSNFDESISHNQKGWFAFKDSVHTGQFQSQNWGGLGASGYLSINGTNTKNVDISSRHWENADLPWMRFIGSENQNVIQMSAENDENESGNIKILSKNGNSTYLSANGISSGNSSTQFYEFTSQDWGGQGSTGLMKINGSSTQNFELTSQSWVNPNFPWFKLSGENLGDAVQIFLDNDGTEAANLNLFSLGRGSSSFTTDSWNMNGSNSTNIHIGSRSWEGTPDLPFINLFGESDFHGIELSITRDGENNQFGWINLMSENGKSLHLSPNNLGVQGVGMSTSTNNSGTFGSLTLHGPNSDNFQFMPGWWDQPDLPRLLLLGTSEIAAIDMGAYPENGIEKAEINLYSTDGSSSNWSPKRFSMRSDSGGERILSGIENNDYGVEVGRIWTHSANEQLSVTEPTRVGLVDVSGEGWNPLVMMDINNNTGNGWAGNINVSGPNSNNFEMGTDGGNPDYPFFALRGENNIDLVHIAGGPDPNNDIGYIQLFSEDGNTNHVNGYGMYINSNPTLSSSFDSYQLKFVNNGREISISADGVTGNVPLDVQNGLNVIGDVVVNGVTEHTSDKRFKKNIKSIALNTLNKVQLIEGVSYEWRQDEFPKKNFSSDKQIGVIAQELEAQFPELVKTNKDGYKSVNYNGFTAVLLEAVKELNAKVEKLEAENNQLKAELSTTQNNTSEIDQLKDQMEALVKMVQTQQTENVYYNESVSTPGLK